jgi:hypothetical protein
MSEPNKLSEEELTAIRSMAEQYTARLRAGEWLTYDCGRELLLRHIDAQSAELAAQAEEIRRLTEELDWHKADWPDLSHEDLKAAAERFSDERKRLIEKCRTEYGHMTMAELVDAFRDCSWEEEGSIDFVMKEKAAQQDAEIRRLREAYTSDDAIRNLGFELTQMVVDSVWQSCPGIGALSDVLWVKFSDVLGRRAAKAMEPQTTKPKD